MRAVSTDKEPIKDIESNSWKVSSIQPEPTDRWRHPLAATDTNRKQTFLRKIWVKRKIIRKFKLSISKDGLVLISWKSPPYF